MEKKILITMEQLVAVMAKEAEKVAMDMAKDTNRPDAGLTVVLSSGLVGAMAAKVLFADDSEYLVNIKDSNVRFETSCDNECPCDHCVPMDKYTAVCKERDELSKKLEGIKKLMEKYV